MEKHFKKVLRITLKHFQGAWEKLYYFRDLGSSSKIILGSMRKYFNGAGKISALFSGSKGLPYWYVKIVEVSGLIVS